MTERANDEYGWIDRYAELTQWDIDLVAAGDHKRAIAECARLYGVPLGRLCMAFTGSQAEAEELVQETLIAAYDGFGSWRGEGTVKSWLHRARHRIAAKACAEDWL